MEVRALAVGNTQVKNNVFIAPMAGYTDYSLRKLQLQAGAGLTFTELVSAKGLMYGGAGSKELLYSGDDIKDTAAQIFGSDAYFMRAACESEHLKDFNIIDINMGCPVPKVFKNGEGSALLTDIKDYLASLKLSLKGNEQIFPLTDNRSDKHGRGLDYVGFVFFRKQTLIRKGIKKNFCKAAIKLNRRKTVDAKTYKQELCSWLGWAKVCNSKNLLRKIIKRKYYEKCVLRCKASKV